MEYRCVATSVEGFVQQLAVAYVTHGYWFYVTGQIPEGKDPAAVDQKLVERYGIAISKWARARRKRRRLANMQYLRHERTFVLVATKGRHEFFERERETICDIRRVPIKFAGYSIGCRIGPDGRWHPCVRMCSQDFANLKEYMAERARHRSKDALVSELNRLPFQPYAPVRRQLLMITRAVNSVRIAASLDTLEFSDMRMRRRIVHPFTSSQAA